MAKLLQHVMPCIHRSLAKSEVGMEHLMEKKVLVGHKLIDAFEKRVLQRLTPNIDLTTFKKDLESLRVEIDVIFYPLVTEPESAPITPVDDTILSALFCDTMPPPTSSRATRKSPTPVVRNICGYSGL